MKYLNQNNFFKKIIPSILAIISLSASAQTIPEKLNPVGCSGKFPNLVTEICYSCGFPIKFGSTEVFSGFGGKQLGSTINNADTPVCSCLPKVIAGVTLNQYQPETLFETKLTPGCFPVLNGAKINLTPGDNSVPATVTTPTFNLIGTQGSRIIQPDKGKRTKAVHVSLWRFPLMYLLDVIPGTTCTAMGPMDIAFMTELNPASNNSALSMMLNLDLLALTNPIALAAQAIKAVAGTLDFGDPVSELSRQKIYWSAGAPGNMGNPTVYDDHSIGVVNSSMLAIAKTVALGHRQFILLGKSGPQALCMPYPKMIYDDNDYKITMTYPIPQTQKILGRCCQPMSSIHDLWSPGKGLVDEQIYVMFQKRSCCIGVPAI